MRETAAPAPAVLGEGLDVRERADTLRHELEALPNVDAVAFSSQVPFEQNNRQFGVATQPGDEAGEVAMHRLDMSPEFLETYDIPLLAGRNLSRSVGNDEQREESEGGNVLVKELRSLGLNVELKEESV